MQKFPSHESEAINCSAVNSISLLGTVHHRRWRWNPFDTENEMRWNSALSRWEYACFLTAQGGRHGDGVYACRMVVNHNMRRVLKGRIRDDGRGWIIQESDLGRRGHNISFSVSKSGEYCLCLNAENDFFWVESLEVKDVQAVEVRPYQARSSFQLNGFPWDDADMFEKFDETMANRDFQQLNDHTWEIIIPLKASGGIDFRSDGVYQLLISSDKNEDLGYSALNHSVDADRHSIGLVSGTGFGSSHGTSEHSAPTLRVMEDGLYRLVLKEESGTYRLEVESDNGECPEFVNDWSTVHVLGTVHDDNQFDPTDAQSVMHKDPRTGVYALELKVKAGKHVINFGLGKELFLDTMALGTWLDQCKDGVLTGIAWHGKPNESNICFENKKTGMLQFTYNARDDIFTIDHADGGQYLLAVSSINSLSLVGSFDEPMVAWDPQSSANLMRCVGGSRHERVVQLEADRAYQYKIVGNQSDWHLVFADYELDGYGMEYGGTQNPAPYDTSLSELKRYGHLTSHGNPPAIVFTPKASGLHRFMVDLRTGAYSVMLIDP